MSKSEIKLANKLYDDGMILEDLERALHRSHHKIRKIIINKKDNPYDRDLNCAIFSDRDCPNNNYWGGMIASDGNMAHDKPRITLASKDKSLIDNFKNFTNTGNKIYKNKDNNYLISVNSKTICGNLRKIWSIVPRKSLILQPPKIQDNKSIRNFIRGVTDGDGHISNISKATKNKIRYPASLVQIYSASYDFIEWINKVIPFKNKIRKNRELYQVDMFNYKDVISFLNWIYHDSTPETRLDRKHAVYQDLLSYNEDAINFGRDLWDDNYKEK